MTHTGHFLFLGSGSSGGVPVVGCSCNVCTSPEAKNKRLRSSGVLTLDGHSLLIDAGPDFRQQALAYHITAIDSLFVTHTHYDHIGGLEELRVFTLKNEQSMPCYLSQDSFSNIQKLFYYYFQKNETHANRKAEFDFRVLEGDSGSFALGEAIVHFMRYHQGSMSVLGLRVGDFAYLTDMSKYNDTLVQQLVGVRVLVIAALRYGRSRVQMNVDEACAFAASIGAKETYLMHMSHEIEYNELISRLPPNIMPAYDGLQISFSW